MSSQNDGTDKIKSSSWLAVLSLQRHGWGTANVQTVVPYAWFTDSR